MKKKIKYSWASYNLDKLPKDSIDRLSLGMVPPNTTVLELGCATGYMTKYLKEKKHCSVVGVEKNRYAAAKARKYAWRVIAGDLNSQKIWRTVRENGPYDVVFASSVVEHLEDPWDILSRIFRVLKPGGKLILTVPNIAFWRARIRLLLGTWEYEEYGIFDRTHTKFFTVYSMRMALKSAGFTVLEERYDPAGGAKWFTPILRLFPNAYAHQVAFLAEKP